MAEDREKALRDRVINRIEYIIKKGDATDGEIWYIGIVARLLDELLEDLTENRI